MARNGTGTYVLPNSIASGDTISASPLQGNFSDLGSEITNSLPRDGQAAMTGQLKADNGSALAPSITFGTDTDTGIFRKDANTIGISAGGTEVATVSSSGIRDANSVVVVGLPTGLGPLPWSGTSAPTGWVRCNGRTIGSASSGATERANADCENLFLHLWTNFADAQIAVSSGRGASAAADWAANKTIALPDLRGRAVFGLDDMGSSLATRLGTIVTNANVNGQTGGTETHVLTEAQLPSITPSGTVISTVSPNPHTHTYTAPGPGVVGTDGAGATAYSQAATTGSVTLSVSSGFTGNAFGSGAAHSNMPPAFVTTYIIKL